MNERSTHRKDGMVGEEESSSDNVPGLVPSEFLFVNEETHELGNSERGVSLQDVRHEASSGREDYTRR